MLKLVCAVAGWPAALAPSSDASQSVKGSAGQLYGYALFNNIDPTYLDHIATIVIQRNETFVDQQVLDYLLKKLRGQRLTPR